MYSHPTSANSVSLNPPPLADRYIILRTDITSSVAVHRVKSAFLALPQVQAVTVDLEDVDHVLRLETNGKLAQQEAINRLNSLGFWGEDLEN